MVERNLEIVIEKLQPIILAGTTGDDYDVLKKVDSRIKTLAVEGQLEFCELESGPITVKAYTKDGQMHVTLCDNHNRRDSVKESSEDTLAAAAGPDPNSLSQEQKHWILRNMGFKGLGKGQWKHFAFDEIINFDLKTDGLIQLAFKLHKAGYQNAQAEQRQGWKTPTI